MTDNNDSEQMHVATAVDSIVNLLQTVEKSIAYADNKVDTLNAQASEAYAVVANMQDRLNTIMEEYTAKLNEIKKLKATLYDEFKKLNIKKESLDGSLQ